MRAIRVPIAPTGQTPFSAANPAPSSALEISPDIPMPVTRRPGEMLVRVKATTIVRDNLTWPELYHDPGAQLGNDFSGVVVSLHGSGETDSSPFKPGDAVYGMMHAERGGAWAEYAVIRGEEASPKPEGLSWEEAAALPLSALTADQALFDKAGLASDLELDRSRPDARRRRVLVTGAAGGVGACLVQLALAAGHSVVAATSSRARNDEFLRSLGVEGSDEYAELSAESDFDVVVDTVGGEVLQRCWGFVKGNGVLVSIDSASWNFVEVHREKGYSRGKDSVRALFFIVEPSKNSMARVSSVVEKHGLKNFVSQVLPFEKVIEGYDLCQNGRAGRGKIVLVP